MPRHRYEYPIQDKLDLVREFLDLSNSWDAERDVRRFGEALYNYKFRPKAMSQDKRLMEWFVGHQKQIEKVFADHNWSNKRKATLERRAGQYLKTCLKALGIPFWTNKEHLKSGNGDGYTSRSCSFVNFGNPNCAGATGGQQLTEDSFIEQVSDLFGSGGWTFAPSTGPYTITHSG